MLISSLVSLKSERNSPQFGWSKANKPDLLVDVVKGRDTGTVVHSDPEADQTLWPTDAFVKDVVENRLVGYQGQPIDDDQTPRAFAIVDRGGKTFETRERFDTFVRHLVQKAGEYMVANHPQVVRPFAYINEADDRDFRIVPSSNSDAFQSEMVVNTADGYQRNDHIPYFPSSGQSPKFAHFDLLNWKLVGVTYGDNHNIDPSTGIPFLMDARQGMKEHGLQQSDVYLRTVYGDGQKAIAMPSSMKRTFEPYRVSIKDDYVPDLNLTEGQDRLAMVFLNNPRPVAQLLHGADPIPKPVTLTERAHSRRPLTNMAFSTQYVLHQEKSLSETTPGHSSISS